jgi:hypothetical protein
VSFELTVSSGEVLAISRELDGIIEALTSGDVDMGQAGWASGHDQLRAKAEDFGGHWRYKRAQWLDDLMHVRNALSQIVVAFEQADRQLAETVSDRPMHALPFIPALGGRS